MARLHDVLTAMVAALEATGAATSTALGIEPNITGSDYPLIRVVPGKATPRKGSGARSLAVLVYFGGKLHDYDGLDSIYAQMAAMEESIVSALRSGSGWQASHIETLFDEDRLPAYKMAAARFDVVFTPA